MIREDRGDLVYRTCPREAGTAITVDEIRELRRRVRPDRLLVGTTSIGK